MLPGLIDAHGHVMGLGFQQLTLDLSATNSLAEAQAAIRAVHEDWSAGTAAKDLDRLVAHIADEIVSYEHEAPLRYAGVAEVREVCRRGLDTATESVAFTVPDLDLTMLTPAEVQETHTNQALQLLVPLGDRRALHEVQLLRAIPCAIPCAIPGALPCALPWAILRGGAHRLAHESGRDQTAFVLLGAHQRRPRR